MACCAWQLPDRPKMYPLSKFEDSCPCGYSERELNAIGE